MDDSPARFTFVGLFSLRIFGWTCWLWQASRGSSGRSGRGWRGGSGCREGSGRRWPYLRGRSPAAYAQPSKRRAVLACCARLSKSSRSGPGLTRAAFARRFCAKMARRCCNGASGLRRTIELVLWFQHQNHNAELDLGFHPTRGVGLAPATDHLGSRWGGGSIGERGRQPLW